MDGSPELSSAVAELVEDAPCGMVVTDADGRLLFINGTLKRWLNLSVATGQVPDRLPDLMTRPGRLFYETHLAPMMHLQGFAREIACTLRVADDEPVPVLLSGVARKDISGKIVRCDYTVFDARERHIYEDELRAARVKAEELAAIVRTSPNAIFRVSEAGLIKSANAGAEKLLGKDPQEILDHHVQDLIGFSTPPDWLGQAIDLCGRDSEAHLETLDSEGRHFETTVVLIFDAVARSSKDYSIVLRDITARKRAEQRLKVAMGEMKHRVKNTLAVVSGIARQTLPSEFRDGFIGRLHALSRAHDVLVDDNQPMAEVGGLLELTAAEAGGEERFRISGSQNVTLSPEQAQSLSMALHELVTNALKYGALSEPSGYVEIACELIDGDVLRLVWQERDGPSVTPPSAYGFGSRMINTLLKFSLGAEVEIEYHPEGVRCEIAFKVG